jgi:hypothetical protein
LEQQPENNLVLAGGGQRRRMVSSLKTATALRLLVEIAGGELGCERHPVRFLQTSAHYAMPYA